MARFPLLPQLDVMARLQDAKPVEKMPKPKRAMAPYKGRQDYLDLMHHLPVGKFVDIPHMYYKSISSVAAKFNKANSLKRIKVSIDTERGVVTVAAFERGADVESMLEVLG